MGIIKNHIGRPTNKTLLIRNILKGILLFIVVAGIFACGYFLNNSGKTKDNGKNVITNNNDKTKKKLVTTKNNVSENDEQIINLYKPFSFYLDDIKSEELYLNDKTYSSMLSSSYKNRIAYFYYTYFIYKPEYEIKLNEDIPIFCTKSSYIEEAYKNIFGEDNFKKEDFIGEVNSLFKYNIANDVFCAEASSGEESHVHFEKAMYDYEKELDEIIIYEYAVIKFYNSDSNIYSYYNDISLTNKVYEGNSLDLENLSNNNLKQKLQKYKLTFKLKDDNYIFKSIEKIK